MGLATIDPHSQKEHTDIHKIPKFCLSGKLFLRYSDLKTSKSGRFVGQRPDGHTFLCKF